MSTGNKSMSFIDHLEELRWHLIRSLIAIFVFAIIAFISKGIIFGEIILGENKTGKSSVIDILLYALFGKMSRGTIADLINKQKKQLL